MEELKNRVVKAIEQVVPDIEVYQDSTNLISGGIMDSVNVMRIIAAFEESFNFELDPSDVEFDNFESIENMATLVEKYIGKE